MIKTILFALFVAAAFSTAFDFGETEKHVDGVIPDDMLEDMAMEVHLLNRAPKRGSSRYDDTTDRRVLKLIKKVIAYSIVVHPKVKESMPRTASRPLYDMVKALGTADYRKTSAVMHFASSMSGLLGRYRLGIGKYMLSRVNRAVMTGRGGIFRIFRKKNGSSYIVLNHRKLGLLRKPHYFKKFAVRYTTYSRAKDQLNLKGETQLATASFLRQLTIGRLRSYVYQQTAYWQRQYEKHIAASAKKAYAAQMRAYHKARKAGKKKNGLVVPQPPAGVHASRTHNKRSPFRMPSAKQIRAAAIAKLRKWQAKMKKKHGAAWLLQMIQARLRGVTLRMRTGTGKGAISGDKPTITFFGTKKTLTGKIRGCPPAGKTGIQHFPSYKGDLGDLISVEIKGGSDKWLVNGMSVQMSAVGKFRTLSKRNIWLGRKSVRSCVGKCVHYTVQKPTQQCSKSCGSPARTYAGRVQCKTEVSGKVVSFRKCVHQRRKKPPTPTKHCRKTPLCVHYVKKRWTGRCPNPGCGRTSRHAGSVQCTEKISRRVVSDSPCSKQGHTRPSPLITVCKPHVEACNKIRERSNKERNRKATQERNTKAAQERSNKYESSRKESTNKWNSRYQGCCCWGSSCSCIWGSACHGAGRSGINCNRCRGGHRGVGSGTCSTVNKCK